MNKKILSLLLTAVLIVTSCATAYAEETLSEDGTSEASTSDSISTSTTSTTVSTTLSAKDREEIQKTLEEQGKTIQKNLEEAEKKLAELEKNSKDTMEYIDALDQKIGFINDRLTVLQEQNDSIEQDIKGLKPLIKKNQKRLDSLSQQIDETEKELEDMKERFQTVFDEYCERLKILYISGDYSIVSLLLSCDDISTLLTRYEMIKSVSKSDTKLLKDVKKRTEEIVTMQDGYNEQLEKFSATKKKLDDQKAKLLKKQQTIEENTREIAAQKVTLASDRAESDRLLAELNAKNQQYTEFRNEDKELLDAVENEIQSLILGLKPVEEVTTAVAGNQDKTTGKTTTKKTSDLYSKSDAVLNMTYPVPGCYGISAGFPNYSSGQYHGGIDFPCSTGSKVVAAQDGIVITVKRLDYSYGYYVMIYHGTDSKGRSVVTLYAHNSSILVNNGDSVKKGQQIAKSGSTGNSTGPHCHFEIRFDGKRVNPTNYLSK